MDSKLFVAGLGALSLASQVQAANDRPNVLLILTDDHSYPHLGAYGNENCVNFNLTPNMDALASDGVLFNKCYTAASTSAPSRSSIFTGQSPMKARVLRFGQPAQSTELFFTDLLREAGYWVGLSGRIHHLSGGSGIDNLQEVYTEMGMAGKAFNSRFNLAESFATKKKNYPLVGEKLGSVLDKMPEEKPFFLYFGISQPHVPNPETWPDVDIDKMKLPDDLPNTEEQRIIYARYLQGVKECDNIVGQMIDALKQRGLYENTLIILMGDNGEWLPSTNVRDLSQPARCKGSLYDRGIHVPLIVRYPQHQKKGHVSNQLVSGLDLSDFILEQAGLESTPTMEGISFTPALKGKKYDGRKYAFAAKSYHPSDLPNYSRAVTNGRYLFKYNMYYKDWRLPFELFDLQEDPFQYVNLFDKPEVADIQKELLYQIDRWILLSADFMPPTSEILRIHELKGVDYKGKKIKTKK